MKITPDILKEAFAVYKGISGNTIVFDVDDVISPIYINELTDEGIEDLVKAFNMVIAYRGQNENLV